MFPKSVDITIKLFIITIIIGIISSIFNIAYAPENLSKTVMIVMSIIIFSLYGILILYISKGKNWARLTWTALFLAGIANAIMNGDSTVFHHVAVKYFYFIQTVLQAAVTILLFLPASNAWFKNKT